MSKQETVKEVKRFVMNKNLVGKGLTIKVTFKDGRVKKYKHDEVFEANKEKLTSLPCWKKYGNYTSTTNLPTWAREFELKK